MYRVFGVVAAVLIVATSASAQSPKGTDGSESGLRNTTHAARTRQPHPTDGGARKSTPRYSGLYLSRPTNYKQALARASRETSRPRSPRTFALPKSSSLYPMRKAVPVSIPPEASKPRKVQAAKSVSPQHKKTKKDSLGKVAPMRVPAPLNMTTDADVSVPNPRVAAKPLQPETHKPIPTTQPGLEREDRLLPVIHSIEVAVSRRLKTNGRKSTEALGQKSPLPKSKTGPLLPLPK